MRPAVTSVPFAPHLVFALIALVLATVAALAGTRPREIYAETWAARATPAAGAVTLAQR